MTTVEMVNRFNVILSQYKGLPSIPTIDIIDFLNLAIFEFIKSRAEEFEQNDKATSDLREAVKNAEISPFLGVTIWAKSDSVIFSLPTDYYRTVHEEVLQGTERKGVVPITHEEYNVLIQDPFNEPDEDNIYKLTYQGYVEIMPKADITKYYLRYIRIPDKISLSLPAETCGDLPESVHDDVVTLAVSLYTNLVMFNNKKEN